MLPQQDEESGDMEVPPHTAAPSIDAPVAFILRALLRTADFHKIRDGAGLLRRSSARLLVYRHACRRLLALLARVHILLADRI